MKVRFGYRPNYEEKWKLCNTMKEAFHWIREQMRANGIKIYYTRCNFSVEQDYIEVDMGSYTLFGYITDLSDDNWNELLGKDKE